MKKQNGIYRLTAMVLILVLLMSGVSRGADGNDPEAQAPVYSDWLRLDGLSGDQDTLSGTQDLSLLLREVALLDAEGALLSRDGVWPVVPNTAYQIQLRFRETPGNGELQFDTAHAPLQYQLPEGLYIGEENLTLPVRIELDDSEFVDAVCACDAALGTLSVSWDPESAAEEKIRAAEDAGFTLILPAVFGNVSTLGFTPNLAVSLQRVETAPLTAEGTDYIISVTGTADARIPEGARLVAAELTESDPQYKAFLEEASRGLDCNPEALTHSRLFDLTITAPDGSAVRPSAPVQVRVTYTEPLLFETVQRFLVVHLAEGGTEFLEPVIEGSAEGGVTSFTFTASSFSLYGTVSSPLSPVRSGGQSSNLADFLDSVVITGAEMNEQGQYVILDGVPYEIQMHFSEKVDAQQFDVGPDGGTLVYTFPNGFTPLPTSGTGVMTGAAGDVLFHYVISGNTLTVTFTFDENSPGYASFLTSENAQFEIHATGVICEETVEFSSQVTGHFDIDDSREVSVEKTGTYDAELNKIKFTVQAHSKGNNTDVHIGDIITGTALTYDPNSLTVTSNLANPVTYIPDTRQGETFGLTIPSMAHGETVTIEYYADVNLSLLTGTGDGHYTFEQTGNKVTITSEENPPGDHDEIYDEDFEHRITLSSNSKTASEPTVRDGKTYITWTIVLNENANISIAGSTVTDTIDSASRQYMRYSGTGIHIEKYKKDGTLADTSDIRWGSDGLSASYLGSTWTYTIPESDADKNYKYVITYETEVDSDLFLTSTTVSNTAGNEYDTDYSGVTVGPTDEEVSAEKTVVKSDVNADSKEAETEWMITFTVPAAGLDSAQIIDSLPSFLDYTTMTWFYDTYKAGSVRVQTGDLLQGESFTVDSTSQEHKVVITFTKNNGDPGLAGTGLTRTIHVYLTTTASYDWLVYAENPESDSRARTHVNTAIVWLNGQRLDVTSSVSYNTTGYDLEKFQDKTAYENNTDLPIYVYKIILTNVNDEAFDEHGYITITDTYDAGYLAFYPIDGTNTPNGCVYGNNKWNKGNFTNQGPYVVDQTEPAGQLVFKVPKVGLPMDNGSYYPYYTIAYALQVKDEDTLERMKEEALHSPGLKVDLENTAISDRLGADTIVTEYTVDALEKTKVSEEYNSDTGTYDLHFKIEVNKDRLKIGDGEMITLKDTLSNLSFDYTSIVINPVLDGDILNRTGNSIIFTLHNETYYTITYTARLIGLHDVHWNNKADLYGYISGTSGTSSSQSGGSGTYRTYSMNVKKYAEGNMNQGLEATFELYEARVKNFDGSDIQEPNWVKVAEFKTNATTGVYQIETVIHAGDTEPKSLRPYSFHDVNGNEQFGSGENYGWQYRIIETVAPDGYQRITDVYEFGISDIPSYSKPYKYLNGDTVTIVNKPVGLPVETVISGTKVLIGKELEDREFTFSLRPEESMKALWGDDYPGGFDGVLTASNDKQGRFRFSLTFTYDDYLDAQKKAGGFFDDSQKSALFYYVVTENLPEGAEDKIWNGVRYDDSQFLVLVRLSVDGGELQTQINCYPYDGTIPTP